jgi:hypothetical protein
MTEAEVVALLVDYTNILLAGVSVYFTIVSAYIAALNYFVGGANFLARFVAYLFVCVVLAMLLVVLFGAQQTHIGLIARLEELAAAGQLSAAGQAVLANSAGGFTIQGVDVSVDDTVRAFIYGVFTATFLVLFHMSFFHRWQAETVPVEIVDR